MIAEQMLSLVEATHERMVVVFALARVGYNIKAGYRENLILRLLLSHTGIHRKCSFRGRVRVKYYPPNFLI